MLINANLLKMGAAAYFIPQAVGFLCTNPLEMLNNNFDDALKTHKIDLLRAAFFSEFSAKFEAFIGKSFYKFFTMVSDNAWISLVAISYLSQKTGFSFKEQKLATAAMFVGGGVLSHFTRYALSKSFPFLEPIIGPRSSEKVAPSEGDLFDGVADEIFGEE